MSTHDDVAAIARELGPQIRDRREEAETLRHTPPALADALAMAGCGGPDWTSARTTGCHVQITLGIEFINVDRGWNNTASDRLDDRDQLKRTTRAQRMAVH